MRYSPITLLCCSITTSALAQPAVLPPLEFDKPYEGKLIVVRPATMAEVARECGNARTNLGYMLACSFQWGSSFCKIIMAPDEEIIARGHKPSWVMRHEVSHCVGWPSHHPGARRPTAGD